MTGATALPQDLEARLAELRSLSSAAAVGFGISRPEHAALKGKADRGVVCSALVALHDERGVQAAADLVRSIRAAVAPLTPAAPIRLWPDTAG